jgi:hypothetical protein
MKTFNTISIASLTLGLVISLMYVFYYTEIKRMNRIISVNEITFITRCLAQSKEPVTRRKLDSCRDVAQRMTEEGLVP